MKKFLQFFTPAVLIVAGLLFVLQQETADQQVAKLKSSSSKHASMDMKKGRAEYFHRLMADPATNEIPANIRSRELEFAANLPKNKNVLSKTKEISYEWTEAGPEDVGGRTRALAIDKDNNYILAGGVSGGIWKSTNGGQTWVMKSTTEQHLSVTCIVQDPNNGDIWYYGTGEFDGNSASGTGASYLGTGVYKSTDAGESWTLLPVTLPSDLTSWSSAWTDNFSYVHNIKINPITGSLFVATAGGFVKRSTDGGNTFENVRGAAREHYYVDLDIASNGTIVAVFSQYGYNTYWGNPNGVDYTPGVYKSTDDGVNWTDITPSTYPSTHNRSVLAIAPSDPNKVYIYTHTGQTLGDTPIVKFHSITISSGDSEDRSANLPDFTDTHSKGYIDPQGDYNMILAVKPDDANLVVIGGTSLFRSFDAFATEDTSVTNVYIGGYHWQGHGDYDNHHPDQHSFVFDPDDPKKVWSGHDGGLSYASDITANATQFAWEDKNNGYNVTQFYSFTLAPDAGDDRMVGGTQDNGSPFFTFDGTTTTSSLDISSGDGALCYWSKNADNADMILVSTQFGSLIRLGAPKSIFDDIPNTFAYAFVHPAGDNLGQLFVHPYSIDPNDPEVLYYPTGTDFYRTTQLQTYNGGGWDGVTTGYAAARSLAIDDGKFTAIAVSDSNSSHIVYMASSTGDSGPMLYRLDDGRTATQYALETNIAPAGYVNRIAVNPTNSNEIIVVLSNYNITGVFYSNDAGVTLTAIEGNLTGDDNNPGPSIRTATIVQTDEGPVYLLGTSIGLFSATTLNGDNTVWTQEAPNLIGNVVVEHLTSRKSDGKVGVGTHGRGAFVGLLQGTTVGVEDETETPFAYALDQNYPNPFNPSTTIKYSVSTATDVSLKIFDVKGELITELVSGVKNAGNHTAVWNGKNQFGQSVASGIYFYKLEADNFIQTKKMMLLK